MWKDFMKMLNTLSYHMPCTAGTDILKTCWLTGSNAGLNVVIDLFFEYASNVWLNLLQQQL